MKFSIFYSWQSDLPNKTNRTAIETALKKVVKNIKNTELTLEIAIDRDTKGLSGTPDINKSIFDKIKNSQIFLSDISIINSNEKTGRKTPNPNVLIELGYAAALLGWQRVICVFNKQYGSPEDLPFDLKFRRPLIFNCSMSNTELEHLTKTLQIAIESIIKDFKNIHTIYSGRDYLRLNENLNHKEYKEIIQSLMHSTTLKDNKSKVWAKSGNKELLSINSHVYFATPTKLGPATAGVSGIDGGFKKIGEKIRVNEEPYNDIEYDLYCSENALNGDFEFHINYYDLE